MRRAAFVTSIGLMLVAPVAISAEKRPVTIDDVFFIRGRGAVATGKVEEGTLRVGDEVLIDGAGPVRVDGIEAFRKRLNEASAGENIGVLFSQLERDQLRRGAVITAAGDGASLISSPAAPTAPTSGRDPRFASTKEQRTQFLGMRDAGLMTDEQIDESLRGLIFSADRRQWLLTAHSNAWLSSVDGTEWHPDTPPD